MERTVIFVDALLVQTHKENKRKKTANSCKKNNTRRQVTFLATAHQHEHWENVFSV